MRHRFHVVLHPLVGVLRRLAQLRAEVGMTLPDCGAAVDASERHPFRLIIKSDKFMLNMRGQPPSLPLDEERERQFVALLESAAHLQRLVPGAVLVGGAAAILYADHRESSDHDHVVADLAERFEMVLEAIEKDDGWATNRVTPGKVILGNLDGIEAGVRQMIRKTPLEVAELELPSRAKVTVPTLEETLRIKAFLTVRRNQTRDYLDLAALSERLGVARTAEVLGGIDDYYADQHEGGDGVASQLVRQLSDPRPADLSVTKQLGSYRRLRRRWSDWGAVSGVLGEVARRMLSP
jgi:hypothetical protein